MEEYIALSNKYRQPGALNRCVKWIYCETEQQA